ncbi:MAG TPA: Hsp70 family protein, partial [Thermoanaerobaculia bacterium]|nr:Hsp70 family protein [Thermoanaerobaculia bacterium]
EIAKAHEKGYTKIDKLLLVGGSTYMPQVIDTVKSKFPFEVRQYDPNQAVAKGAALFGYKCYLDEQIKIRIAEQTGQEAETVEVEKVESRVIEQAQSEVARAHGLALPGLKALVEKKITNVTSKSFGMVTYNQMDREMVYNLILIDAQVPAKHKEEFYTREEGQTGVELRCMENKLTDREAEVSDSKEIGTAELTFGRTMPKNTPIEVTFQLGPDGLLSLHGREQTTGREIKADFKTESIMSREEVEEAKGRNLSLRVA